MERVVLAPSTHALRSLPAVRAHARAVPAWLWLGLLVAVAATVRIALASTTVAPWIHPDEQIYAALAESMATDGSFSVRGEGFDAWSFGPLYPLALSLVYVLFADMPTIYALAKAANAVAWSAAAVPAYLLARRMLGKNASLGVAALSVLVPAGIYTTKLMTESLAYPLFLAAVVAMLRALERPSLRTDLVALAFVAAAVGARAQMVALFPAFATAIAAAALLERDAGRRTQAVVARFRQHVATSTVLVLGAVGGAFALTAGAVDQVLGLKATMLDRFAVADAPAMFLYHMAELDLAAGVIPFVAFVLVASTAVRRRTTERSLRLFSILAAATLAWLLALVALYASQPKPYPQIYERYTFYCLPLFVVALFVWASGGVRPSRRALIVTSAAAAALPAVLPYGGLLNGAGWGVNSSTVSLVPWGLLRHFVGTGPAFLAALLAFTCTLAYVIVRAGHARPWVPVRLVVYVFVAVGAVAYIANAKVSENVHRIGGAATPDWIDRAVEPGARADVIWSGYAARGWHGWVSVWQTDLFNRSVSSVLALREAIPDPLPEPRLTQRGGAFWRDGEPFAARYVVADSSLPIDGVAVAVEPRSQLTLYRVDGPVRLRSERGRG